MQSVWGGGWAGASSRSLMDALMRDAHRFPKPAAEGGAPASAEAESALVCTQTRSSHRRMDV